MQDDQVIEQPSTADTMAAQGSDAVDNPVCPCVGGNQLWLENASGQSLSVAMSVGGVSGPILPQTAEKPTILPNTLANSHGPIELSVNGRTARLLAGRDPSMIIRPEDVQVSFVAGRRATTLRPLTKEAQGIPVQSENNGADLSAFLDGISGEATDIDMVMVCQAAEGQGAITAEGLHQVNGLSDESLNWLSNSLVQNTIASTANEAEQIALFSRTVAKNGRGQVIAALREVILDGKFYIKRISSWGGKHAIIFKGAHRSRSFLTAISYGLRNGKMSYISSYAEAAAGKAWNVARGTARSNLLGFVIAASFDVSAFVQDEDPEKNWGGLLGSLSVTFVKVWAAGFAGVMLAGAIAATAASAGVALPVIAVVGLGVGIAIGVGWALDKLDDWLGIKDRVRRIGRRFAGAISRGMEAASAFVEEVSTNVDSLIDGWFRDFERSLRQNDPNGWCALFCSNPIDQANAWMRGLGGRSVNWP